jgi:chaperonin cofactor prefoldin
MITETMTALSKATSEAGKTFVKVNYMILDEAISQLDELKHRLEVMKVQSRELEDQVKDLTDRLAFKMNGK